jgi:putative aldouronate transport system permease protein
MKKKSVKLSQLNRMMPFDYVNTVIMVILCVLVLYPFLYVIKLSFSGDVSSTISLSIIPQTVSTEAYRKVIRNEYILRGFVNTLRRLIVGTPLTLLVTIMAAYTLSKRTFPHRTFWTGFFVFTMFFNGGLIPDYLLVRSLRINDTLFALVFPRLVDTFNLLIMRNYFMSIPESLEESAKIDGAGHFRCLFLIMLPLSTPIIATIALWTMVNHWSWWFDCLIYITTPAKMVLQVVMRRIVLEGTMQMMDQSGFLDENYVNSESLKAAVIMVTTIPIVCIYPFLQKYFVKGILVGSLKG